MFQFFSHAREVKSSLTEFSYLPKESYYFDSACQTLRPMKVQLAEQDYYQNFNACGGRVKYKWGEQVDAMVVEARSSLLKLAGKSEKDYTVVFTLNTTYGINLILHQLRPEKFSTIVTTDREHNSVFLPAMTWASRYKKERIIIEREENGGIRINDLPDSPGVFIANTVSNIDGKVFENIRETADTIHKREGIVLLDGAQMFSSHAYLLQDIDFDAVFGSGHKMYGPSIGFIILKKSLIRELDPYLIGGGTVSDVGENNFHLIHDDQELHALLEPGLQNWAGIAGLLAAVKWKNTSSQSLLEKLSADLFSYLEADDRINLINARASSTISFYVEDLDSHQLALYLAEQNIMCRSGYFCCHYYLKNKKKYPPLLRISLGLHTTEKDIKFFKYTLSFILSHF